MQRSHSMHVNLSVEDMVAVSSSSSSGVSPSRINGTSLPRSTSGVAILDIMNPRSYSLEKRRDSRLQSEACVHLIPLVLLLCYFCLWIASTEVPVLGDEISRRANLKSRVPADFDPPGSQVLATVEERGVEKLTKTLPSSSKKVREAN